MYKFQTSRGTDRDAEGVEEEGNGARKLPQRGPGLQKTSFGIFYSLKKHT